ncbi:MAG: hypothetical protein LKJ83_07425 [Eubacteriaceae bacterium]|jgi:predicted RNase H-like HicB family nuclease|nr:hypothetical protein [Eubacteriaceae bacterium]
MTTYINVEYAVVLRPEAGSVNAFVPLFDVNVKGSTEEEALEMARDCIEMTAHFMLEDHAVIPGPVAMNAIKTHPGEKISSVSASIPKQIK